MKTEQNNTIRQERGCADRKQQEKPVRTRIKICGLTRLEDIQAVNEAKPDFCGFIVEFPKAEETSQELSYEFSGKSWMRVFCR